MDHQLFGQFLTQLRRERGMTQKELADILHVTDKAVSKWETGKGFPDIKLIEPLAEALGVSVVELIQCKRQEAVHLTVAEAGQVVSAAMDQTHRITTCRYLRLLRWLLAAIAIFCAYEPMLHIAVRIMAWYCFHVTADDLGVIGGADGPTTIITTVHHSGVFAWLIPLIMGLICVLCLVLFLRVRKLEKKLN